MAAIVYFRKVSEDAGHVRYAFGAEPGALVRHLSLERAGGRSAAEDGRTDHLFLKASRKINALRAESGTWPDHGMSVS
ncbi:hypothetical protein [Streptomyces sp. NPDC048603]|uniref:hypothetical protein n=1 Tax=Streptomyces sp. NPDC048603 TaxID=3365577 RepID=UPI00371576BB